MEKTIERIELVFENLDVAVIPSQYLNSFSFSRPYAFSVKPDAPILKERFWDRHNDITSIDVYFTDKSKKTVTPDWSDGATEDENQLQSATETEHGLEVRFDSLAGPALFFYVKGELLFHSCAMDEGEPYGIFVNYPQSHLKVWDGRYKSLYKTAFDYFPRGRVVYRKDQDLFMIYHDPCMDEVTCTSLFEPIYGGHNYCLKTDEHYQCHNCNRNYITLEDE